VTGKERHSEKRPHDVIGRDQSDATISQGLPAVSRNEERVEADSLGTPGAHNPVDPLAADSAPRTVRITSLWCSAPRWS
jgi:hypothetical protein